MVRKHYRFTGQVQGVGFRYRARHAADGMCITGWVKNQWDGSVEMEVQGTEEANYIHIDSIECREIPMEEHETSFHVR